MAALSREEMTRHLIKLVAMSFKCMSDEELEKTYNETIEEITKNFEHDIVNGKGDQDG